MNLSSRELFPGEHPYLISTDKGKVGCLICFDSIFPYLARTTANEGAELLVIITNDVGSDIKSYDEGTRAYIQALGRINAALAKESDCVFELVCGIPILLKGEPIL